MRSALPEDLGVGTANIVGVEGQRINDLIGVGATQRDVANGRSQNRIGGKDGFTAVCAGGPGRLPGEAARVQRNPTHAVATGSFGDIFEETRCGDYGFLADQLGEAVPIPVKASENLLAAGIDKRGNKGAAFNGLRGQRLEARDGDDGPSMDFGPSFDRGQADPQAGE